MSLRIHKVEARVVDHPVRLDGAILSYLGRHEASRYLRVTVEGDDGLLGFGEGATAPVWSGESAETGLWFVENLLGPKLAGATLDHPSEALAWMDRELHGNSFTKSAVDIALWDLWARSQGVSVSSLVADRESVAWIPTRVSIGAYPPEETVRLAVEFWERGVRTLKFKTGVPGIDDVARLKAVRERLGPEPVFTIDANGAHATADDAVRAIEALVPFNLALAEQPTPRDRIGLLAKVRKRVPVPILADEAVFTPGHLEEAIDLDAFDILSIYPGKNGGFTHSLAMARRAQAAGKSCAIGSNLETDLGQAAMICLASSLSVFPVDRIACDFQASLFYASSYVRPPITYQDGKVEAPRGFGFGVEPDSAYLSFE
ncbi:mandelate racemase/muconate lactonizing enzyme family protein [Singulisphaera sp. PoT]|uniref:mandelate racemase/muconate lactonizing enzyme family protein n=1 Tax=Singulisphaera sp. PoT TaxID=3411797 RepID=UPI003BF5B9C4